MTATHYRLTRFYRDLPKGTTGTLVKSFKDANGYQYCRLYFGRNLTGQRMTASLPRDVLEVVEKNSAMITLK